jgi:NAD(P)-dependent dehydrogenase (short-subunit alcohol dehydrogenase family)
VGHFGRLDLLFNNAGSGTPAKTIDEITLDEWHAVVAVNLHGAFLCARAAFAQMRRQSPQGGRIINNGSISAHVPRPGSVGYTATKHAVTGLTKTISLDGRRYNIQCGQIDIGNAATPMTQRMANGVPQANGTTMVEPRMDVASVAESVLLMANLRPDANVQFLMVAAKDMPFIGRG